MNHRSEVEDALAELRAAAPGPDEVYPSTMDPSVRRYLDRLVRGQLVQWRNIERRLARMEEKLVEQEETSATL